MSDIISRNKLLATVARVSDRTLLQIETRLQNKIAGLQKCVPWPALIHSLAGDLEIIWAEQKRRESQRNDHKR